MFRTIAKLCFPNPFDRILKRCRRRGQKKILLGWNRGLGDIPLGLYAMVERIKKFIPEAEITFLTRPNLLSGFSMLTSIKTLAAPQWKRGVQVDVSKTLQELKINSTDFDCIIPAPSPTDWVAWQRGTLTPRLTWDSSHDALWKSFDLPDGYTYVGVQVSAETHYGLWRNWSLQRWDELFSRLGNVRFILFGYGNTPQFSLPNIIDLRGKTSLFELLSIVKNRCSHLVLPDSGILSMVYYLDVSFPIQVISLWADPRHGILKQAVASPNPQLVHHPLMGHGRDLDHVTATQVVERLCPTRPLTDCLSVATIQHTDTSRTGCILMAGGQGSRLGFSGPKGMFEICGKSLFQRICEKAPSHNFPIAVMTSPSNHKQTVDFFAKHSNFGKEVYFFAQDEVPFLDAKKNPLPLMAPNGNGSLFKSFVGAGLFNLFQKKGIDTVITLPVENPLADPADGALIAHHRACQAEATVKAVLREEQSESMGALVERAGKIEILEYLDLNPKEHYLFSYTGVMALSLSFIYRMAEVDLPYHLVKKVPPGRTDWVWKREKFVFDALPFARKVAALCYPKNQCYAPLKNQDSIAGVEKILKSSLVTLHGGQSH